MVSVIFSEKFQSEKRENVNVASKLQFYICAGQKHNCRRDIKYYKMLIIK